jgi:putative aldouronate transport system substrate-binding protein
MKKIILVMAAGVILSCFAGCTKNTEASGSSTGYTFGEGKTFHSEKPVTYTMYFSDASWYPITDSWKTEGVFKKITDKTNVTLDLTSFDSGDYTDKVKLAINAGSAAYIIPKIYDETAFVDGGAVIAVSDYVKYMPNYEAFYKKYNMQKELDTLTQADGKYYRLPGMLEKPLQDYTLMIRKDIFDAAGINIAGLEKTWTWDDLYDTLVKVKKYMVSSGMCSEKDYIWSDLWCGSQSGQGKGGNLLKLAGASYGVPAGWGITNGLDYDAQKDEWYCASTSESFKKMVSVLNKFVKGGILDPETFTQDDTTAMNKFYNGKTVITSTNRGQYAAFVQGLKTGCGKDESSLYITCYPTGTNKYTAENARLENGVMISKNALKALGKDDFIKMLRFVDWLWYSPEAYQLTKWGVEGETFKFTTMDDGKKIKKLLPGFKCSGLGIGGADTDTDIRLKWGYACGNFYYGHTVAEMSDNFIPAIQDYYDRLGKCREIRPVNPKVAATEDEKEQLNLWGTPLTDNINAWTLQFITGQKDINGDWDKYIASCKNLNEDQLVKLTNDIYKRK